MIRAKAGFLTVLFATAVTAHATELWQWEHEASFSGTANVFDGGPPVVRSRQTDGPDDRSLRASARDATQSGSQGASASAGGSSSINPDGEWLFVSVAFSVGYLSSAFPGGDNPGGEATGELSSVFNVVMPGSEVSVGFGLRIREDHPEVFDGSTQVMIENITQSSIILELTEEFFPDEALLLGVDAGDLIRITSTMSGQGSVGPGSLRFYDSRFSLGFRVPEPSTACFLLPGLATLKAPRKRNFTKSPPVVVTGHFKQPTI